MTIQVLVRDVFSIPEGSITVDCLQPLTHESLQEVLQWLDLVKRRIARNGKPNIVLEAEARVNSASANQLTDRTLSRDDPA